MASKNLYLRYIIFTFLLFFLFVPLLHAQTDGPVAGTRYFLDTSSDTPRFVQRLSWVGGEYALRYEVVIERVDSGNYHEVLREFTSALFIDVSLLQGRYRFCVIPFDYLGSPGARSNWMYIEVLAALIPELDYFPDSFVYSDDDTIYEMNISGRNLVAGAEIYLHDSDSGRIDPFNIYINEDRSGMRLSFYKEQLLAGNYELFVKNPGGLETSRYLTVVLLESTEPELELIELPKLVIESSKRFNFFVSIAWMPLFSVYDNGNRFHDKLFFPAGVAFRLGMASAKRGAVNFGVEFLGQWCALDSSYGEHSTMHFLTPGLNLLMQKWSPNEKTAMTFRLGAGYGSLLSSSNTESFLDSVHANLSISFLGLIGKYTYFEAGIDFSHWFTGSVSGSFRPWIGLGFRF
jgi:hypothetical protein